MVDAGQDAPGDEPALGALWPNGSVLMARRHR